MLITALPLKVAPEPMSEPVLRVAVNWPALLAYAVWSLGAPSFSEKR